MLRRFLFIAGLFFVIGLSICGVFYWHRHDPAAAELFLKCITPIGTISAVLFALYGDYLRELIEPIQVRIDVPAQTNNILDKWRIGNDIYDAYFHHLRVRNLTPHKPIKDCRVWLKKVYTQDVAGAWTEEMKFAVPRLMEWAPFEFSKDKRTFSTQQVFDFGKTLAQNNVNRHFEITIAREQGGAFKRNFTVGQKLGVVLYVTADNYQEENEFCFEIEVPQSLPGRLVTPAKNRPSPKVFLA